MSNQFAKVVETRIFGCTLHNDTTRLPLGDYSGATSATATTKANPLRGTAIWDDCMYVVTGASINGGATGGSYTITVQTDAFANTLGYTGLPIAQITLGPNSPTTGLIMDNLHQSKASPLPTHVLITQGSTGRATFQISVIAKQYRGMLGTQGSMSAERILQGSFMKSVANLTDDTTFVIGRTDTDLGMYRMRLWDTFFGWAIAGSTITGTWDVDIVGKVNGKTTTFCTTGVAGTLTTIGDKKPIINQFYGLCPNPTHIIVTEVSAGGIAGLEVVGLAKSGRGSLAKR